MLTLILQMITNAKDIDDRRHVTDDRRHVTEDG